MENLIFSLNATVPIFFTMILGFVFRKVGLMDEEFTESLRNASSVDEFMDIIVVFRSFPGKLSGRVERYLCGILRTDNDDLYRDLDFDFLSVERQKYPGRICSGGLPEQRCNPWYCIYPEYIWNIRHGAIDDHCFGADL